MVSQCRTGCGQQGTKERTKDEMFVSSRIGLVPLRTVREGREAAGHAYA